MRRTARLLSGSALAVAAAWLIAPVAHGVEHGGLEVSPSTVVPGDRVTVNTAACGGSGAAAGDASAVGAGQFTLAPGARDGAAASGQFRVPASAQPGTYEIVAKCAEGARQVKGDLVVTLTSAGGQTQQVHPRGSVKTGVGGASDRDPVQTAAGVAALAVAAAGGTWLLHRRASGDGI
jgi:hypothetical protein